MTVLIAGGTGRLGTLVTDALTARGVAVRVLTRDRRRAAHLKGDVHVVEGDVRDRRSVDKAVAGVATVVSAVHGFAGPGRVTPQTVDVEGNTNLIAAAKEEAADFVLLSVVGSSPDHPMDLFRCKHAAEQLLERSGIPSTVVRATAFAELWAEMCGKGIVFGRGDNPINFVAVNDVATAVGQAVLDQGLRGRVLEIGGPDNVTLNQLTALVQDLRGAPARVRHVPRWLLRAMAPLHRLPRAALALDTLDMTFEPILYPSMPAPRPLRDALAAHLRSESVPLTP